MPRRKSGRGRSSAAVGCRGSRQPVPWGSGGGRLHRV